MKLTEKVINGGITFIFIFWMYHQLINFFCSKQILKYAMNIKQYRLAIAAGLIGLPSTYLKGRKQKK